VEFIESELIDDVIKPEVSEEFVLAELVSEPKVT
jgi:hypothetical protein